MRSESDPDLEVKIHATGDVRNGFEFEIKRSENLQQTDDVPSSRTPLQWIDAEHLDLKAMLNNGEYNIDHVPVCALEKSVHTIQPPGKGLNKVDLVSSNLIATPRYILSLTTCTCLVRVQSPFENEIHFQIYHTNNR